MEANCRSSLKSHDIFSHEVHLLIISLIINFLTNNVSRSSTVVMTGYIFSTKKRLYGCFVSSVS